jgi:hypothetical protein
VPVIRTDQSFTVSAWVKLRNLPAHNMVVTSQSGQKGSGFALYYKYVSATEKYWSFMMTQSDLNSSDAGYAARRSISNSDFPAVEDTWVHLAGVYDSNAGSLSLYVNGKDVGASDAADPNGFRPDWNAIGSLQVGRTWYNSRLTDYLDGFISDVHIYPGALDYLQISTEADEYTRL